MINVTVAKPINGNLKEVVREMVRALPVGSHGITVMVYIEGLDSVSDAKVMGLPIIFYPTSGRDDLVGKVRLGFTMGNNENITIPPGGCLDVE